MLHRPATAVRILMPCLLLAASLACGPAELAAPTSEGVQELVLTTFPNAGDEVIVRAVEHEPGATDARAEAEFRGADVAVLMQAVDEAWEVAGVELGEHLYSVPELRAIGETLATIQAVSNALETYRRAHDRYPLLDDQVGLRELVPDFYPADAALVDGWGNPLRYRLQGDEYALTSSGPDGNPANPDDIILVTGPDDVQQ